MNRNLPVTAAHCIDDVDVNNRSPEQQRALHALHSDGGFSSWERALASALPENRADILQNALIELYDFAAKAGVNHTEISDWGFALGELHNIGGGADGLQAIISEAKKQAEKGSGNEAAAKPPNGNWQQAAFTAEQLQRMKFPPISWLVPNIIPADGVTLLCSRPKFGKSWLVYDLCIGATTDRFILGEIKPAQGDVLYLALEDSKRRLQRRMTKLLPTFSGKWPDSLTITTEWRRLHEGGLDDIRGWHEETKAKGGKPIIVAIDVLAKVRKPTGNKPVYEADYEALTGLCQLARELNIAIVVVHHTRKMAADDLMETVNGSYGLTGAVDTVLVMASKAGGSVLDIRGRDVESDELAIQFSKNSCRWTILGSAADIHQSEQRKAIIATLTDSGEPMRIDPLAAAVGMKRNGVEVLLGRMVKDCSIRRTGTGRYAHKDYVEPVEAAKPIKSVRSVSSVSPARQMEGDRQAVDNARERDGVCRSVRSDRKFTTKADDAGAAAERVKSQTDQTDGQIEPQATGEPEKSESIDLSGRETDQTDQTDAAAVASDDLSIPDSLRRICAQCKGSDGTERPHQIGGRLVLLHDECVRFYQREKAKAGTCP